MQTCGDRVLLGHLQFLGFPHGGAVPLFSGLYLSIASARREHFQEIRFQTLLVSPCECFGFKPLDNFQDTGCVAKIAIMVKLEGCK